MAYLTLTQLKDWLLAESLRSDYKWDDTINALSSGVAAAFDRYTNRTLEYTAAAVDTFRGNLDTYILSAYPVSSITSVHLREDISSDWQAQTVNDVVEQWDANSGLIQFTYPLSTSEAMVKVTYAGGYSTLPNALIYAFRIQVMEDWRTLDRTGMSIVAQPVPQKTASVKLNDEVAEILKSYTRMQIL